MKKTKLLIATAALSLAAVAAGTVSTMAWYKVTDSAKTGVGSITNPGTITVAGPADTTTSFGFEIAATFAQNAAPAGDLILSHAGTSAYETYIVNTAGIAVQVSESNGNLTLITGKALYKQYDITLAGTWKAVENGAAGGGDLTVAEQYSILSNSTEKYVLKLSIKDTLAGDENNVDQERGYLAKEMQENKTIFADENATSITFEVPVSEFADQTNGKKDVTTYSFLVREDGGTVDTSGTTSTVDLANFAIAITGSASIQEIGG